MNKYLVSLFAIAGAAGVVIAAQDTSLTQREVRDPLQLESWLETNASDAETRVAGIEDGSATITAGVGAKNGATVTAAETRGIAHKTVITLASTPVVVTEQGAGTNAVGGVKIYDLPEGRILVLGVTVDSIAVTVDANAIDNADGGDIAFGTAVPGIDGVLNGTAVDLCPATSVDPITNAVSSALATSAQFDGTTTAKDIYFNMLVDDGDVSATHTNTVAGTFTIHWVNLGDY